MSGGEEHSRMSPSSKRELVGAVSAAHGDGSVGEMLKMVLWSQESNNVMFYSLTVDKMIVDSKASIEEAWRRRRRRRRRKKRGSNDGKRRRGRRRERNGAEGVRVVILTLASQEQSLPIVTHMLDNFTHKFNRLMKTTQKDISTTRLHETEELVSKESGLNLSLIVLGRAPSPNKEELSGSEFDKSSLDGVSPWLVLNRYTLLEKYLSPHKEEISGSEFEESSVHGVSSRLRHTLLRLLKKSVVCADYVNACILVLSSPSFGTRVPPSINNR